MDIVGLHLYTLLLNRLQQTKANPKRDWELEAIHQTVIKKPHGIFPLPPLPLRRASKSNNCSTISALRTNES